MRYPRFAIVGRPNVGKSSLLNALARSRIAIVEKTPGVTRDRVSAIVRHGGLCAEVIDTAGLGRLTGAPLEREISGQIAAAVDLADAILLVMDARIGLTAQDREAADFIRKSGKPVILVANKVDTVREELSLGDFFELGFGAAVPTAAISGHGRAVLFERMVDLLGRDAFVPETKRDEAALVAFVGRRNAGKSTLVNRLVGEERMVVSEIPGTTRDAVDVPFEWGGRRFVAVDTAGLRRRAQATDSVEFYSQTRAEKAIRRADVLVLVIEAQSPISNIDKTIGQRAADFYKPCVVAINKWDLVDQSKMEEFVEYVSAKLPGLAGSPMVFISALSGEGVDELMERVAELRVEAATRITTGELNRLIHEATSRRRPKPRHGKVGKIYYGTQAESLPPTIVLFVNDKKVFDSTYLRYLSNYLRQRTPLVHVPICFEIRQTARPPKETERPGKTNR